MTNAIKAIPSYYKNTLMRSRIEVRWAFTLDKLGLDWQYEEQGYDLGNGVWYLPDFAVYDTEKWYLEVKGIQPTPDELLKAMLLAKGLKSKVVIVWNGIPAKITRLYSVSINRFGRIAATNPLKDAFQRFDKDKRERILGLARSYKFD